MAIFFGALINSNLERKKGKVVCKAVLTANGK